MTRLRLLLARLGVRVALLGIRIANCGNALSRRFAPPPDPRLRKIQELVRININQTWVIEEELRV